MQKKLKLWQIRLLAAANAAVIVISFFTGYLTKDVSGTDKSAESAEPDTSIAVISDEIIQEEPVRAVSETWATRISGDTVLIYEYYYSGDGIVERAEESAPLLFHGMTRSDIELSASDWTVVSFVPGEVVLRKTVPGLSSQHYVIGVYNGYIAVFYDNDTNGSGLKEITIVPVAALPEDEQNRLRAGIHITGDEALVKALESYGS